jgi:hypothetical protein
MGKISGSDIRIQIFYPSGSGMKNLDHISVSKEIIFLTKIVKIFGADPGSGTEKKFGSGILV